MISQHRLLRSGGVLLLGLLVIAGMGMGLAWVLKTQGAPDYVVTLACLALGMVCGVPLGLIAWMAGSEP